MAIRRNALVAPFSVNSPLLDSSPADKSAKTDTKTSATKNTSVVARTHQLWFQNVANAINGSLQLSSVIPATSTSPGEAGTIVPFAGGFYLAVGNNSWLKFVGATF
jgi:hypothetical protein